MKVKDALTRKVGPLPAWAWIAIIAAGVLLWVVLKHRKAPPPAGQGGEGRFLQPPAVAVFPPDQEDEGNDDQDEDNDKGRRHHRHGHRHRGRHPDHDRRRDDDDGRRRPGGLLPPHPPDQDSPVPRKPRVPLGGS